MWIKRVLSVCCCWKERTWRSSRLAAVVALSWQEAWLELAEKVVELFEVYSPLPKYPSPPRLVSNLCNGSVPTLGGCWPCFLLFCCR